MLFEQCRIEPDEAVFCGVVFAVVYFQRDGFYALQRQGYDRGGRAGFYVLLFEDGLVIEKDADGDVGQRGIGINRVLGAESGEARGDVVVDFGIGMTADAVMKTGVFFGDRFSIGHRAIETGRVIFTEEGAVDVLRGFRLLIQVTGPLICSMAVTASIGMDRAVLPSG